MKYLVNGVETEAGPSAATISHGTDRVYVEVDGRKETALAVRSGDSVLVSYLGHSYRVEPVSGRRAKHTAASSGDVLSPMPGVLVEVKCAEGDLVTKGQVLAILEAMKTQQPLVAPFDGIVSKISFSAGSQVEDGVLIAKVTPTSPSSS